MLLNCYCYYPNEMKVYTSYNETDSTAHSHHNHNHHHHEDEAANKSSSSSCEMDVIYFAGSKAPLNKRAKLLASEPNSSASLIGDECCGDEMTKPAGRKRASKSTASLSKQSASACGNTSGDDELGEVKAPAILDKSMDGVGIKPEVSISHTSLR